MSLGTLTHDSKIDWLELNETGSKLLFRDRRAKLTLVDVNTLSRHTLDTNCTFVQVLLLP
jgi:intraflagellar transport protein 172